jgi:hypothetical protein
MEKNSVETEAKTFHRGELSLIEHAFIGGTDEIEGEQWGFDRIFAFLKREKNKENVQKKLLKPLFLIAGTKTIEEVNSDRMQTKRLKGLPFLFNIKQQMVINLEDEYVEQYIELGDVNEKGEVSGEWKVGLTDGNGNEVDSSKLRLDSLFKKYFILEKDTNGKGMVLKINLQNKKGKE